MRRYALQHKTRKTYYVRPGPENDVYTRSIKKATTYLTKADAEGYQVQEDIIVPVEVTIKLV